MEENNGNLDKSEEHLEERHDESMSADSSYSSFGPMEDLFNKNTASFRCLGQIQISRSSILRDPLYPFPELEDPHLENILWGSDSNPEYDDVGCERYKDLCSEEKIKPFRRVLNALAGAELSMKYYQLSEKAMRTICETLQYNRFIKHVSFEHVILKPELLAHISGMIKANTAIISLSLRRCQVDVLGARWLAEGIRAAKSLADLDLSHNHMGDEAIEMLTYALQFNSSIRKLNLSHNDLGEQALIALGPAIEENSALNELDLSWNRFYTAPGMEAFMSGLSENIGLKSLNLAWNGIGDKGTVRCIMQYLKSESTYLEHLNLSNNRITGVTIKMLRNGLKSNESLISLDLSYNCLTADDVEFMARVFFEPRTEPVPFNHIDFGQTWVKKSFDQVHKRIQKMGCSVSFGGIYSDYKLKGPDVKEMLLKRGKYVAMKPKKKKQKRDLGVFMIQLADDPVEKEKFEGLIKAQKIKLDRDLIDMVMKTWETPKKAVDIKNMRDKYLALYPDTTLPPQKTKRAKGKKKKQAKKK